MANEVKIMSDSQKEELVLKIAEQEMNIAKLRAVVEASKAAGMEMIEVERAIKQGENMISVLKKLAVEL